VGSAQWAEAGPERCPLQPAKPAHCPLPTGDE
jgi:hypothetical protein